MRILVQISFLLAVISSCVKDISLDLPPYQPKIVVQGQIQPGVPPFVLLSKSLSLYAPTSVQDLESNFVTDAQVYIQSGTDSIQLDLICTDSLPPQLIPIVAELLGYSPDDLALLNICAYSTLDPNWFGVVGNTYNLTIQHEGEIYQASTSIKNPIPLDTLYWDERDNLQGYGFMSAILSDPIGTGDAYRWQARRLNLFPDGTPKDPNFLAPFNSAVDDQFFDGTTFSFFYDNPGSYEDSTISDNVKGYYALGDTVVVSWSVIPYDAYLFLRYEDQQVANGGSPFAAPANIPSNVSNNALGLWVGYSPSIDTIICTN